MSELSGVFQDLLPVLQRFRCKPNLRRMETILLHEDVKIRAEAEGAFTKPDVFSGYVSLEATVCYQSPGWLVG